MNSESIIDPFVLINGYCQGTFPMADAVTGQIDWYTPDPRGIIPLDEFHVPDRLRRCLRKDLFEIRFDSAFPEVVLGCADRETTWISGVMRHSYENLHVLGFAHSVEAWRSGELVGGLYGVAIRGAFFGESMFYRAPNASKAALIALVEHLKKQNYVLLDTQMVTPLTAQFGARWISCHDYEKRLSAALEVECTFY